MTEDAVLRANVMSRRTPHIIKYSLYCGAGNDTVFGGDGDSITTSDDGTLIYKTERLGSMEGSFSVVDNRAYIGTEQGDLYCLNLADGKTIWKARIGADSDSTPAVYEGKVYTAAENGVSLLHASASEAESNPGSQELVGRGLDKGVKRRRSVELYRLG